LSDPSTEEEEFFFLDGKRENVKKIFFFWGDSIFGDVICAMARFDEENLHVSYHYTSLGSLSM
jgi:hypothetical protein